jgi:hypothetical protein
MFLHWWDKFVIGKINSKSWEYIPHLCTCPMISLTLKTGKCIPTKWQKGKKKHICLVKCILNFNEELGRFIKDWNRHPLWHPFLYPFPTDVPLPLCGDGPSSICRRNQIAHTEQDGLAKVNSQKSRKLLWTAQTMCREQPSGVVVDPIFLGFWCRGRFFLASSSSSNPAYPSF